MDTSLWLVEIFRVSSHQAQQNILSALQEVPGVTALGTSQDRTPYVVFECSPLMTRSIGRLLRDIDPRAELTHSSRMPKVPSEGGIA
jgi:selenocysteine lyase/cysteine desulfurase